MPEPVRVTEPKSIACRESAALMKWNFPNDRVFEVDGLKHANLTDSAADCHRVTGAKCRNVLHGIGEKENAGANLREATKPATSGKAARQVVHCCVPARLTRPPSNVQVLGLFSESVGRRDVLQIAKDFSS